MSDEIKSGKEILDEFFREIKDISDIEESVVDKIIKLYNSENLSQKYLENALLELREKADNDED